MNGDLIGTLRRLPVHISPQVYDYQAPPGHVTDYVVVQCPAAKQAKIEKAFSVLVTLSKGNTASELVVIDAVSGDTLGLLLPISQDGHGSALSVTCVNGRHSIWLTTKSAPAAAAGLLYSSSTRRRRRGEGPCGAVTMAIVA